LASAGRLAEASGFEGVKFSQRKIAISFAILRTSSGVNTTASTVAEGLVWKEELAPKKEGQTKVQLGTSIILKEAEPIKGALLTG